MALSVLIVDDDPHVRRVLRMELEAAGFRVVDEAADGYAAIALVVTHEPDFVILDQMMPMLNGSDAIGAISAVAPSTRVIVYSALDSASVARRAIADGAVAYLDKAEPVAALIGVLANL
jgi:DNA-binding NarL/FixJ family response regulator